MFGKKPIDPKLARPLSELMAEGLAPCGKTFAGSAIRTGPSYFDFTCAETLILQHKPAEVRQAQEIVIAALSKSGPMTKRQLVHTTGLSEDLLDALLHTPLGGGFDKPEEARASLLSADRGLVTERCGRYTVNAPDELKARQEEAIARAELYLQQACAGLQQANRLLHMLAPFSTGIAYALSENNGRLHCSNLTPAQARSRWEQKPVDHAGQTVEWASVLVMLQELQLVTDEELPLWQTSEQSREQWVWLALTLVSMVQSPLEQLVGYERLTAKMKDAHLCFELDVFPRFAQHIELAFRTLAHVDTASVMNAVYVMSISNVDTNPNVGISALGLLDALGRINPQVASIECDRAIAVLRLSVNRQWLDGVVRWQETGNRLTAIKQQLLSTEQQLSGATRWAKHLDREYILPTKIMERLSCMGSQEDALKIVSELAFPGITAEVAQVGRAFIAATIAGDSGARAQAARQFIAFKRQGLLGLAEFGDKPVPQVIVRRMSISGGHQTGLYKDQGHYGLNSRDADFIRDLLGLPGAFDAVVKLSETRTKMTIENDDIYEDMLIARMNNDRDRLQELRLQLLSMVSKATACSAARQVEHDTICGDYAGGANLACSGLKFMDFSHIRDLTCDALRCRVWMRLKGKAFPLTSADLAEFRAFHERWHRNQPGDEAIDYAKLARLALNDQAQIPDDQMNDILS